MTPQSRVSRPVVLIAIGSVSIRGAVHREIHRRYGQDYRAVSVSRPVDAVAVLEELDASGEEVALLLADDATPTPAPDSTSVFEASRRRFPDVRRGLVIPWGSWADRSTVTSILALMAAGHIDYYVVQPRSTPDEGFHRTITEFLGEWQRAAGINTGGATIVGDESLPRTHDLARVLARSGQPVSVVSSDSVDGRRLFDDDGASPADAPLVLLADGTVLRNPTDARIAQARGLTTDLPTGEVDLAIVGAGPAGLAAAVYSASEGLRTLVLERDAIGGQAGSSSLIRNYLGFSRGISGAELATRSYQQAWVFGAGFAHTREVTGLTQPGTGDTFALTVAPGESLLARAVIVATGVTYRRLPLPDLDAYVGSAVFYGASAVEAKAQTGRDVHVVGGGNSAGQAALHLARYARSVSLIVRGATLAESMSQYLVDELATAGVTIYTRARVIGGGGHHGRLDHLLIGDRDSDTVTEVASEAVFITIGAAPHTGWLPDAVLRDRWGSILTGSDVILEGGPRAWPLDRAPGALETSVPGIFAVGDVRRGSLKRVAAAVGEGSTVVTAVHAFLAERAERASIAARS